MARDKGEAALLDAVDGGAHNNLSLLELLRPASPEERERHTRESFRQESRAALELIADVLVKQRPDQLLGPFWTMLDDGSRRSAPSWAMRRGSRPSCT